MSSVSGVNEISSLRDSRGSTLDTLRTDAVGADGAGATGDEADGNGVDVDGIGAGGIGAGAVSAGSGAGSGGVVVRLCSAIGVGAINGVVAAAANGDGSGTEASSGDTGPSSTTDSHASDGSRLLREPAGGTMHAYRHASTAA